MPLASRSAIQRQQCYLSDHETLRTFQFRIDNSQKIVGRNWRLSTPPPQELFRTVREFVNNFCCWLHTLDSINGLPCPERHCLYRSGYRLVYGKRLEATDRDSFASYYVLPFTDKLTLKGLCSLYARTQNTVRRIRPA